MEIRVCARPEGFPIEESFQLSGEEIVEMGDTFTHDYNRVWEAREALKNESDTTRSQDGADQAVIPNHNSPGPAETDLPVTSVDQPPSTKEDIVEEQEAPPASKVDVAPRSNTPEDDATSMYSGYSYSSRASSGTASSGDSASGTDQGDGLAEIGMAFLGDPTQNMESLPLAHLWHDLANHLKQEDIASPVDLFAERDAIMR